jgi:hypothetical protein
MSEADDSLRELANAAGYFFQERLCEEVKQTHSQHGWRVAVEEHRWCSGNGSEGFIDLVLAKGSFRMVIEAKRTRNARWVFLVSKLTNRSQVRARCLWTRRIAGEPTQASWSDSQVLPSSPEAKFCVIRGQGDRDQPMLERLGGILLHSIESLAEEELRLGSPSPYGGDRRFYFPLIVTNSQMYACFYDPEKVDLRSGELPEGDFEPISFIRFRKGLSTAMPVPGETASLEEANRAKERTIFIVEGARIGEILRDWDI